MTKFWFCAFTVVGFWVVGDVDEVEELSVEDDDVVLSVEELVD